MFEWLTNYGVQQHSFEHRDLNIDDRLQLQDQINEVRRNYHDTLVLMDSVQGMQNEVAREVASAVKRITAASVESGTRVNVLLSEDEEYLELDARQKALDAALRMINAQLEYWKNDLRILNSVFYNRF